METASEKRTWMMRENRGLAESALLKAEPLPDFWETLSSRLAAGDSKMDCQGVGLSSICSTMIDR